MESGDILEAIKVICSNASDQKTDEILKQFVQYVEDYSWYLYPTKEFQHTLTEDMNLIIHNEEFLEALYGYLSDDNLMIVINSLFLIFIISRHKTISSFSEDVKLSFDSVFEIIGKEIDDFWSINKKTHILGSKDVVHVLLGIMFVNYCVLYYLFVFIVI